MKTIFRVYLLLILISVFSNAQKTSNRIAWLSDTHIGFSSASTILRMARNEINSMKDIELIIVSGDITESGKTEDLHLAKQILDSLKRPYYIIPGNHDTKWSESGSTAFSLLFGNDKFKFIYNGIAFIGLHQGPIMKMGDGHFSPEDLTWLDSVLLKVNKNQPIVFVTHYGIDQSIDNWYELIKRTKKFNTIAVFHGHGHSNKLYNYEGLHEVMSRSSLSSRGSEGGFTIVEFKSDSLYFFEKTINNESIRLWATLSSGKRDFKKDLIKYDRPDFSINEKFPNIKIKWTYNTNHTIASTPAAIDGKVIVGNSEGVVYCISSDKGKKIWEFKTGNAVYSSPAVWEDKVVFGSADHYIYCLNIANKKMLWKVKTDAPVVASPKIWNNKVLIGGSDNKFRSIDLLTGKILWEYSDIEGFIETMPCVYDDKVIFGAWDSHLYCLNVNDGREIWKWSNGRSNILYSPAACIPVAFEGKVFIVAPDRFITAIDIISGKNIWLTNKYSVRECIGISEDGSNVYAKCMNDSLIALNTKSSNPEIVWTTKCGYGSDIDPCMPVEKEGVVFFGTKNGYIYALDAQTGKILWQYRIGVTIVNTIRPIDKNHIIVSDFDGRVMMLEVY